jgi:hypothetical protein
LAIFTASMDSLMVPIWFTCRAKKEIQGQEEWRVGTRSGDGADLVHLQGCRRTSKECERGR